MTDLGRLRVSLTKHNSHKVARLLKDYDAAEVFAHIDEVHAERAQARKNLSALANDILPPVWFQAQVLGADAIDALVLLAIVFSHHSLIEVMSNPALKKGFAGTIERAQLDTKAYSNFARVIEQLGYATRVERGISVSFNLRGIFEIPGLGPLVSELFRLKLMEAGWDGKSTVADEAIRLGFQNVFGISPDDLKAWLVAGAQPVAAASSLLAKDQEFFEGGVEWDETEDFNFHAGHVERDIEEVTRAASPKSTASRLHNDIQNRLYKFLCAQIGAAHVGTEQNTGSGTSVDVVTRHQGKITFFEIKTGASVRSNIRQALPQLLEYAYWPENDRADRLVIVSHLAITKSAIRYIEHLKLRFELPIEYKQFDMKNNILVD